MSLLHFTYSRLTGIKLPSYKPGQYITVRIKIPGERIYLIRQVQLVQAATGEIYRISVKREDEFQPNGKVSVFLHNQVNIGDTIEVSVPAGDFYLDTESSTPVTLISGGVGITPMMSMYETIAKESPDRPVTFIHSARTRKHQAFHERLVELNASMPNSKYEALYSEEGDGFITREFLAEHVLEGSDIYVCGPVPFMQVRH